MVSDQKKERVIDSIKKLIALGVSEKEIVGNLTDVGINVTEAKLLINEAKGLGVPGLPKPPKKVEKNLYDKNTKNLSVDDQIAGQLNIKASALGVTKNPGNIQKPILPTSPDEISQNLELGLKVKSGQPSQTFESKENETISDVLPPTFSKPIDLEKKKEVNQEIPKKKFGLFGKKSTKDPIAELQKELNLTSKSVEEKKEVVPIVNKTKKVEVAQPQQVVEKMMEEKVAEKVASSVSNNELEQLWKKGIVTAINSKLSEMKKLKNDIDQEVSSKVDGAVKKELAQFKVLLESQKALMISTNTEALDDKQKEITLIIDSKISELKKQSAQLADGIIKVEAAKKEQEASLQKVQTILSDAKRTKTQLMVEMNSELMKAKSDAQAFIDSSEKHLEELDERVNKTLQLEKNVADGLVREAEQKIEKMTLSKTNDLIEKLEVKLNNIKVMEKKIDPEKIEEKIILLDEFKKQFLVNMQENLTQINEAIKEINSKSEVADKLLASKTLAIDAKIAELSKFEKSFAEKIESLLKK